MSDALAPCPFCKSRMEVIDGTYVGHTHGGVWCPIQTNLFDVKRWSMLGADLASPLSAAAMKRAARTVAIENRDEYSDPHSWCVCQKIADAIDALPSPTPAQMLAEAREIPQVQRVAKAGRALVERWKSQDWKTGHTLDFITELGAALAALEAGNG